MLYLRLRRATRPLAAVSTAFRELDSTLTRPPVLLMKLRACCKKAASHLTECLAQLLIGRLVPMCALCHSNPVPLRQPDKPTEWPRDAHTTDRPVGAFALGLGSGVLAAGG